MHCPECNTNNKQREKYKNKICPDCFNNKHITFHKYIRSRLSDVCWLSDNGTEDASLYEINRRCNRIIIDCYKKQNKKINKTWKSCNIEGTSPCEVANFFSTQFLN